MVSDADDTSERTRPSQVLSWGSHSLCAFCAQSCDPVQMEIMSLLSIRRGVESRDGASCTDRDSLHHPREFLPPSSSAANNNTWVSPDSVRIGGGTNWHHEKAQCELKDSSYGLTQRSLAIRLLSSASRARLNHNVSLTLSLLNCTNLSAPRIPSSRSGGLRRLNFASIFASLWISGPKPPPGYRIRASTRYSEWEQD